MELRDAIEAGKARVGVVGLGYVGLPLAMEFCAKGFSVVGLDINAERVSRLAKGQSYVLDVSDEAVRGAIARGKFLVSTDFELLKDVDAVCICVPTPLSKAKDPDVSYIVAAVDELKTRLHRNMIIVLESTTYPGTTEELVLPEIEKRGLRVGQDAFLCFSPERVDPGNKVYHTGNTPKVIGGVTPECTRMGVLLYGKIMSQVVAVSTARAAEMAKLLENTFRAVNIGLINEMAMMCDRMGIDIWEVIRAASTKPFGFMPFTPGPGIGGHCIPLDPMYLSWKAKSYDFYNKFIELASDINGNMPRYVVTKTAEALNTIHKCLNGARVLILGMAYKKDIDDLRESPGLEIFRLLKEQGARVEYHDPFVPSFLEQGGTVKSVPLTETSVREYDCVLLCTDHTTLDYAMVAEKARLIVDTRNAFSEFPGGHIVRLGAGPVRPSVESALREAATTSEN